MTAKKQTVLKNFSQLKPFWQGFLIGLASPLTWLNYYRILWTIRFRFWRAKRKYGKRA